MPENKIMLSTRDLERIRVIESVISGRQSQVDGAQRLDLSSRQLRRLQRKYERFGASGIISRLQGKASNHQLEDGVKHLVIKRVSQEYSDFGPSLAAEYLLERHQICIGIETLRQLMIQEGLWQAKYKKKRAIHQQRMRRLRFGELIQMDGSHHDWFEGRADKCCLLVLIDDATSMIVDALFCEAETTENYFTVVKRYLKKYGMPMAFYTDKHGVFRVNAKEAQTGNGLTQFGRAMEQLGIELINAHSPQAKGRVERANSTLQDRLIKAMRIDRISGMIEGNIYLPSFIEKYNAKFAKPPQGDANAHAELQLDDSALDHILSLHSQRLLTKNLECSYHNVTYQIQAQDQKYRLQGKDILVCESASGEVTLFFQGEPLIYQVLDKHYRAKPIQDDKTLNLTVDRVIKSQKSRPPASNNPWRHFVINPGKYWQRKMKQVTR